MILIINEFGTVISKKEKRIIVKTKRKKEEYPIEKIEQIIISSPSSLTEGAVRLAVENYVDIVYTSFSGKVLARVYPCTLGGTTLTRREQARAYFDERGVLLIKEIIRSKLKNQLFLIKRLNKTRNNLFLLEIEELKRNLEKVEDIKFKDIEDLKRIILGYEGYGASLYFKCLSKILPIKNRDPKSQDIVNISFNYGYGLLYSQVERACILAGLDPYLGFLHCDRYGKPSMVLDMVEQFRPIIDRAIITLFARKQISNEDLEKINETFLLTKNGKKKIIEEVMKILNWKIFYNKSKIEVKKIILEQSREIVRYLLGQKEKINFFCWEE